MIEAETRKPRILLIAPMPDTAQTDTNVIGGNKVMAGEQMREFSARGFDVDAIDTSGGVTNLPAWKVRAIRLARFLRVVRGAAHKIWHCQIVFIIIAPWSALSLASFFWFVCKLTRKHLVVRISGGDMMIYYGNYGAFARWFADRTYMRSSLVYVETQYLHRNFKDWDNFRWFPNTRDLKSVSPASRDKVNNLIFLARLEMDKGLLEALIACRNLPESCHLNVFGPGMSDTDFSLFDDHPRASYCGVIEPSEIPQVMREHDLLLYPSYYGSEGYPGSILEAFQCGVPAVAAKYGGVPELVEHEKSGLLIEPRSASEIEDAVRRLIDDPKLYRRLCEGAKQRGDDFRSANWYDRVAEELHGILQN